MRDTQVSVDNVLVRLYFVRGPIRNHLTMIEHHNTIWGPFGRNLHEDLLAVSGQGAAMDSRAEHRHILHGRHENETIHDENGMRHFYDEWGRWMDRSPGNPDQRYREGHNQPGVSA